MAFKRPKKQPRFADLKAVLAQTRDTENPLYQVVQELIERLDQTKDVTDEKFEAVSPENILKNTANKFATYHTKENETAALPNSVQLLQGPRIVFDDTIINERTVSVPPYRDLVEGIPVNPPIDTGRVYALDVNGYTQVEMKDSLGRGVRFASDNVVIAKVTEPTGIARGQGVYIAGAAGANSLVRLAKSDNIGTMPAIGIVLDTAANNAFTRVITGGTLQGVNTSAFVEGVSLFVSPTVAGGFTDTLPIYPNYAQRVGFVTRSHATQGEILVLTTGTTTDPRLHAPSHSDGGVDEVDITALGGYPGGTATFLRADHTFAAPPGGGGGGTGDVVGPASAIDSNVASYDGTTGKLIKDSLIPSIQVARRDQINNFTEPQTITSNTRQLELIGSGAVQIHLNDTSQPVDKRKFRIFNNTQYLVIDAVNDAVSAVEGTSLLLDRLGNAIFPKNVTVNGTGGIYERSRPYANGELVPVTFGTYVSTPHLTITSSVMGYTRSGLNQMYVQLFMNGTVNAGAPNVAQYVLTLPEGVLSIQSLVVPIAVYDTTGWATGVISLATGSPQGLIYGSALRPWVAGQSVYVSGSFWVGVA